jgi:Mrp family chromosome partitioning ATPase
MRQDLKINEATGMPANFGPMEDADGRARITGPCGDTMEVWLRVQEGCIERVRYTTDGCWSSILAGSSAASLAEGMIIEDAARISQEDVLEAVGGLPEESRHCALLAANTIGAAVADYRDRNEGCGECREKDCSAKARRANESEKDFADRRAIQRRLCRIKHKIVVLSGKGGVGKSTVAVNLAAALSLGGRRVGLLDVDIHGPSVPKMLNMEDAQLELEGDTILPIELGDLKVMSIGFLLRHADDAIIWRGPMKIGVIKQFLKDVAWGDLDVLVIDCPPGTGDEPLSVAQLIPDADGAIVVTTPQDVALADVRKSVNFCREVNLPILGVVENMSGFTCPKCREHIAIFKQDGGERMAAEMGVPFLGRIPIDPAFVEACDEGRVRIHKTAGHPGIEALSKIAEAVGDALQ